MEFLKFLGIACSFLILKIWAQQLSLCHQKWNSMELPGFLVILFWAYQEKKEKKGINYLGSFLFSLILVCTFLWWYNRELSHLHFHPELSQPSLPSTSHLDPFYIQNDFAQSYHICDIFQGFFLICHHFFFLFPI